jgi:N-acetylmuramic acid 6-phosphate etherase
VDVTVPGSRPFDESRVDSPTEGRNPRTVDIDRLSTVDIVRRLNAEDATVPAAVAAALPELAAAVDLVVAALAGGGRLHYVGAGTSGRLGAMDAEELGPTYGLEAGRAVAHVAAYDTVSGPDGRTAVADGEDDAGTGAALGRLAGRGDVVVGVSASGRTPYVAEALQAARRAGAATVLVSSNPRAPLGGDVDVHVCTDTGPEAVTGSTRLKAGTAQKLVLNTLSTAAMIRLGRTWSNLMIGAVATNAKLRGRLVQALVAATGEAPDTCGVALDAADGDGRAALVSLLGGVPVDAARTALAAAGGVPRAALAALAAYGSSSSSSTRWTAASSADAPAPEMPTSRATRSFSSSS